jgi:L-2,4-diaminobutyric acid acetyltransferase
MAAEVSRRAARREGLEEYVGRRDTAPAVRASAHVSTSGTVELVSPVPADGAVIHALVRDCPPLDLNSVYAYLLLCEHHAETCVRAMRDGETVGFVSAYRIPQRPEVLFVWQVAVAPVMRGSGLARRMLNRLLARDAVRECRYIETTVSPSNLPSRRLFESLAREHDTALAESVLFSESAFGPASHEAEVLFRIGPLHPSNKRYLNHES